MIIHYPIVSLRTLVVLTTLLLNSTLAFSATYTVTNTYDVGEGSMRWAIESANSDPGLDLIDFDIPGAGPHTIQLAAHLPVLTDSVVIDGYTQPGAAPADESSPAVLRIEINGNNLYSCLNLESGSNTVRGLVINRCYEAGIDINSLDGGNVIEGNYIGTDVTGAIDYGNGNHGVRVTDSPYNRIGGKKPAARNVISGNNDNGVEILLPLAVFNQVEGNYIGVDASGNQPLGNLGNGVLIKEGAGYNTIGPGNVISSNFNAGIYLDGTVTRVTGNTIVANLVGTDAFGDGELGNGLGIRLNYSDDNTLIGNVASSSTGGSPQTGTGFVVARSNDNTFKENTAIHNVNRGFRLFGAESNTFKENVAIGNAHDGFSADGNESSGASRDNTLKGNSATENGEDGFSFEDGTSTNTLKDNTSYGNSGFGYVDDSSGSGTSNTANKYKRNICDNNGGGDSSPEGLCTPQS